MKSFLPKPPTGLLYITSLPNLLFTETPGTPQIMQRTNLAGTEWRDVLVMRHGIFTALLSYNLNSKMVYIIKYK